MLRSHLPMKLSLEEQAFLKQWMYDENHFMEGQGPAKRLQIAHGVRPGDLGLLVAAAIPDPAEQQAAAETPLKSAVAWPWTEDELSNRLLEARSIVSSRQHASTAC